MPFNGKGQNCGGVVTGFSIMTTLQPIQPSELMSFGPNIPSLFFPTPPYSPDLAPSDFSLFPMLKRPLKGRRLETIPEIKTNVTKEFKGITKKKYTYTASASGNTAGISVCVGKQSTLKENQTCNCSRKYILCYDFSLRTF